MKTIPLSQGRTALVDECDFETLNQFNWHFHPTDRGGYACRKIYFNDETGVRRGRHKFMHHDLLGKISGQTIDHINRNGLDNRRENLRFCSRSQNMANRSFARIGLRGVYYVEARKKWTAKICVKYQRIHLGYFANDTDAARAYDRAAIFHFGEFAQLNFPQEVA